MSDRLLVVIAAPSATGKSTVITRLTERRPDLFVSISVTTRAMRAGEADGIHYHFVTDDAFEKMISDGELLEYAGVWKKRYGTPAEPVREALARGCDVVFDIDVQGAVQIRKSCPDCVLIFMVTPSVDEMKRRLIGRGTETAEQVTLRLAGAAREMETASSFDYLVVNERVDQAADDIEAIIDAERLRMSRKASLLDKLKEEAKSC